MIAITTYIFITDHGVFLEDCHSIYTPINYLHIIIYYLFVYTVWSSTFSLLVPILSIDESYVRWVFKFVQIIEKFDKYTFAF